MKRRKNRKPSLSSECVVIGYMSPEKIRRISELALSMESSKEQMLRQMLGYLPV